MVIYIFYILLLISFLVISGLIFRYTLKFNYLSPNFKYAVGTFGLIACVLIIFSFYLLMQIDGDTSASSNNSTVSGGLNF